ncbi:YqhR family membrane protein [Bacillus piscicola]|uniref:YqhR family membrane protein n=1 Tax=Bacillus piscicola TaxID=1632684 RepID=UPI001F09E52B|nr:YqhR family membrane protein [Bacillus piscicola]
MEKQWTYNQRILCIGLFGGLFWSIVGYFLYLLHFTKVGPGIALMPWALPEWKNTYIGHLIGILVIGIISIGIAFLYRLLLQKWESIWIAGAFGLLLWVMVFYVLHPVFPGLETVAEMNKKTLTTTLCLFIVYGVFIGYSISYEFNEMQQNDA